MVLWKYASSLMKMFGIPQTLPPKTVSIILSCSLITAHTYIIQIRVGSSIQQRPKNFLSSIWSIVILIRNYLRQQISINPPSLSILALGYNPPKSSSSRKKQYWYYLQANRQSLSYSSIYLKNLLGRIPASAIWAANLSKQYF